MPLRVLVTVGISIFTQTIFQVQPNFKLQGLNTLNNIIDRFRTANNEQGNVSPVRLSNFIEENEQNLVNEKGNLINELYSYIIQDLNTRPSEISAELNSIIAYKRLKNLKSIANGTKFFLIHTATFVDEICAEVIKRFLINQENVNAELINVPELSVDAFQMANKGLYNYTKILFEKIYELRAENHEIMIIGTGGYKAQIPYTILQSIFSGISVYYLHQLFNELIRLPNIPILFMDMNIVANNVNFFNNLNAQWMNEQTLINNFSDQFKNPTIHLFLNKIERDNQTLFGLNQIGMLLLEIFNTQQRLNHKINIRAVKEIDHHQYFFKTDLTKLKSGPIFLIFSTGISLLSQAIQYYLRNRDKLQSNSPMRKIIEFYEENLNERRISAEDSARNLVESWNESERNNFKPHIINELYRFITIYRENNQLNTTCAELNTLKRLIDEKYISNNNIRGCFIISDTYIGDICGEVLKNFCNLNYANGQDFFLKRRINGLNYDFKSFKDIGLTALIKEIIFQTFYQTRNNIEMQIVLCATGGFKAETAFTTLLGMLLGNPVFYIHENQRNLIYFPPIPLVLDYARIIRYFDHLYNLQHGINVEIYKNYSKIWDQNQDKDNMDLFIKNINNNYFLNEVGEIIFGMLINSPLFQEVLALENDFLIERIEGDGFRREGNQLAEIDWRPPAGPPEPAGAQGVPPLNNFLRPMLNRTYVNGGLYLVGGLGLKPIWIGPYHEVRWPQYLPNFGGGTIQIGFTISSHLYLEIFFNSNQVSQFQESLQNQLSNRIQKILNEIYEFQLNRQVNIILPNNYISKILMDKLIERVKIVNGII